YLAARGAIVEVACNAHARRKFYDAQNSDAARSHAALWPGIASSTLWRRKPRNRLKRNTWTMPAPTRCAFACAKRKRCRSGPTFDAGWKNSVTRFAKEPDGSGHQLYLRQLGCAGALHRGRRFRIGLGR